MPDLHDSFARLGLTHFADTGAIRRAYARELKQIDQQHDIAGFQMLREAYELALAWAKAQQQQQQQQAHAHAHAVQSTPPSAPGVASAESPEQLGYVAYQAFNAAGAQLPADQQASWHELLRHQLADDRLINLMARASFEAHLVHALASGWQPGHEGMFDAAVAELGWRDSRALAPFGGAGALLNRAIDDRLALDTMPPKVLKAASWLIARLRDPQPPTDDELQHHRFHLELLTQRFPALLAIMSNRDHARAWLLALEKFPWCVPPAPAPEATPQPMPSRWPDRRPPTRREPMFRRRPILVLLLLGICLIFGLYATAPQRAIPRRAPRVEIPDIPVAKTQLDEIASRIHYQPKGKPASAGTVAYQVFLQEDRAFIGMNKLQSSNDPAFDEAVARAIRESPPFPPHTATIFKLSYTHKVTRKRVPASRAGTPSH